MQSISAKHKSSPIVKKKIKVYIYFFFSKKEKNVYEKMLTIFFSSFECLQIWAYRFLANINPPSFPEISKLLLLLLVNKQSISKYFTMFYFYFFFKHWNILSYVFVADINPPQFFWSVKKIINFAKPKLEQRDFAISIPNLKREGAKQEV